MLKQEAAKRKQLEKLGIDYDFSGYAQKDVGEAETPVKKSPALKKAASAKKEKTTGSATSVRGVATSVSLRTTTVCGCGADNQNVTLPRAAAGGRSGAEWAKIAAFLESRFRTGQGL